jgi:hypothetical protein
MVSGTACLWREQRDADARGDADPVVLDDERLRERLADPRRERARNVGIGHVEHENGELVAAKARNHIIWPHSPLEPAHDLL